MLVATCCGSPTRMCDVLLSSFNGWTFSHQRLRAKHTHTPCIDTDAHRHAQLVQKPSHRRHDVVPIDWFCFSEPPIRAVIRTSHTHASLVALVYHPSGSFVFSCSTATTIVKANVILYRIITRCSYVRYGPRHAGLSVSSSHDPHITTRPSSTGR